MATTAAEMRAITAVFSAHGVQETLPLRAAGYSEPDPASQSYPFKPIGDDSNARP